MLSDWMTILQSQNEWANEKRNTQSDNAFETVSQTDHNFMCLILFVFHLAVAYHRCFI